MSTTTATPMPTLRHLLGLVALLASTHIIAIECIEIDNGLNGEPEVECGADTVEIQFNTRQPFAGKVFVKGHYTEAKCRVDYSQQATLRPTGGIVLRHGACDMDRQRMISPQGMQFSAVVVVSFHETFITKIDRAFHIKCMYRELARTVESSLEVSELPTTQLAHSFPMPVCTYTIRRDEIDGPVLRYARVGDQVVHRWECQSAMYGILVHSCSVEDGQGERTEIVDANGCHVDQYLLGDPTYIEALNMAYRESHVFKFADRVAVRFQCQIRLCMKEDNGCAGITPPICGAAAAALPAAATNGSADASGEAAELPRSRLRFRRDVASFRPVDGDFLSQYIYVLDTTEDPHEDLAEDESRAAAFDRFLLRTRGVVVGDAGGTVCLSSAAFGVLVAALGLVFVAVAFVALLLCCHKLRIGSAKCVDAADAGCRMSSLWSAR